MAACCSFPQITFFGLFTDSLTAKESRKTECKKRERKKVINKIKMLQMSSANKAWWYIPIIPTQGRQRQEDFS